MLVTVVDVTERKRGRGAHRPYGASRCADRIAQPGFFQEGLGRNACGAASRVSG